MEAHGAFVTQERSRVNDSQGRDLGKLFGRDVILMGSSRVCGKIGKGFLTGGSSLKKGLF